MSDLVDFEKPMQALLTEYGYKIMPFRELPENCQLSIAHYMCVDGAAWAVDNPAYPDWKWGEGTPLPWDKALRDEMMADLKAFMPRFIEDFGDELFGYAEVSTRGLAQVIAECHPDYDDYYEDGFGSCKRQPCEYPEPTWAAILIRDTEILQDGWNRFSNYYDLGIEKMPIVWYA